MSLILDALRKSEAERQRGHAPMLHSPASRQRIPRRIWPLAGTVAALAMVGGVSWVMLGSNAAERSEDADSIAETDTDPAVQLTQPEVAAARATESGSLSTEPVLQRESAPMMATDVSLGNAAPALQGSGGTGGGEWPDPALNAAATTAAQPNQGQVAVAPPPVVSAPVPPVANPVAATIPAQPDPTLPRRVDGLSDPAARPFIPSEPEVVADASATAAIPTIHELDFNVRRELPKLNMSMLVYAKDPARRFALINGKRYMPGGEAIDGKVLVVDVLPDGLVCEINGQRFLLPRQ